VKQSIGRWDVSHKMALSTKAPPKRSTETVDLKELIVRDWKHPQKLKDHFDLWLKTKPPVIEALAATVFGSGQVCL
jgi:hypothetical protein